MQREGPYLLGGHSYGGAVAVQIALVLESWGHHVALVMVCAKACMLSPMPAMLAGCVRHSAWSRHCTRQHADELLCTKRIHNASHDLG